MINYISYKLYMATAIYMIYNISIYKYPRHLYIMEQPKHLKLKGLLAFKLLHELNKKRLCGDELAKAIGEKFGAKLTPGTIYPALKFLRKMKLVSYKKFGRKKTYSLTEEGKDELRILKRSFKRIFSGFL